MAELAKARSVLVIINYFNIIIGLPFLLLLLVCNYCLIPVTKNRQELVN